MVIEKLVEEKKVSGKFATYDVDLSQAIETVLTPKKVLKPPPFLVNPSQLSPGEITFLESFCLTRDTRFGLESLTWTELCSSFDYFLAYVLLMVDLRRQKQKKKEGFVKKCLRI